jgi:thiamine-monophosphate kinase
MRETQIVERIRALAASGYRPPSLVRGIGDDCAILRPRSNEELVFTSDFTLEGRHFTLATHTPVDIGHQALARSLSDLAAMGATPVFCLVSLALPAALGANWISSFYRGLLALARGHKIALAGGDLARFDSVLIDVTCCGSVPRGRALLRSGAKSGHRLYVTGELGASAHGLATRAGPFWRRHLRPSPRIEAGLSLRRLRASACIDLSDGLSLDLARLCRESNVGADLTSPLPVARGASLAEALDGGEDYELLFSVPPGKKVPATFGALPVSQIGVVTHRHPGQVWLDGRPLQSKGFDHFA